MLSLARPAVIDEVRRAPDLMLALKQVLDQDSTPGQFLLTGSADLVTARVVADALPGRVEYVHLWPLSQAEMSGRLESVIDVLLPARCRRCSELRRAAPRVRTSSSPEAFPRRSIGRRAGGHATSLLYVQTVLGHDLGAVGEIRVDRAKVERLLRLLASRGDGLVNYSAVARDLALDDKTVKAHVELLEQLFLVRRLVPWSANLGARQVKTPKLVLSDSGMAAALIGADATRYAAPDQGALAGALLETFVVMELVKQATWSVNPVELFFYRDSEQRKVDLVIESATGDVAAVEIKAAASASGADARGLRLLRAKLGDRFKAGVVVYSGEHALPLDDRIWALPLLGAMAVRKPASDRHGAPRAPAANRCSTQRTTPRFARVVSQRSKRVSNGGFAYLPGKASIRRPRASGRGVI